MAQRQVYIGALPKVESLVDNDEILIRRGGSTMMASASGILEEMRNSATCCGVEVIKNWDFNQLINPDTKWYYVWDRFLFVQYVRPASVVHGAAFPKTVAYGMYLHMTPNYLNSFYMGIWQLKWGTQGYPGVITRKESFCMWNGYSFMNRTGNVSANNPAIDTVNWKIIFKIPAFLGGQVSTAPQNHFYVERLNLVELDIDQQGAPLNVRRRIDGMGNEITLSGEWVAGPFNQWGGSYFQELINPWNYFPMTYSQFRFDCKTPPNEGNVWGNKVDGDSVMFNINAPGEFLNNTLTGHSVMHDNDVGPLGAILNNNLSGGSWMRYNILIGDSSFSHITGNILSDQSQVTNNFLDNGCYINHNDLKFSYIQYNELHEPTAPLLGEYTSIWGNLLHGYGCHLSENVIDSSGWINFNTYSGYGGFIYDNKVGKHSIIGWNDLGSFAEISFNEINTNGGPLGPFVPNCIISQNKLIGNARIKLVTIDADFIAIQASILGCNTRILSCTMLQGSTISSLVMHWPGHIENKTIAAVIVECEITRPWNIPGVIAISKVQIRSLTTNSNDSAVVPITPLSLQLDISNEPTAGIIWIDTNSGVEDIQTIDVGTNHPFFKEITLKPASSGQQFYLSPGGNIIGAPGVGVTFSDPEDFIVLRMKQIDPIFWVNEYQVINYKKY